MINHDLLDIKIEEIVAILKKEYKIRSEIPVRIEMPVGSGRLSVLEKIVDFVYGKSEKQILVLFPTYSMLREFESILKTKLHNVSFSIESRMFNQKKCNLCRYSFFNKHFDLFIKNTYSAVVFVDSFMFVEKKPNIIKNLFVCSEFNVFIDSTSTSNNNSNYFNSKTVYKISLEEVIEISNLQEESESLFITNYFVKLLESLGFVNINTHKRIKFKSNMIREIDVLAHNLRGTEIIFEIKVYRSIDVSLSTVNKAINYLSKLKNDSEKLNDNCENQYYYLVVIGKVNEEIKEEAYKNGINILDILDLYKLSIGDSELYKLLLKNIPFVINDFEEITQSSKAILLLKQLSNHNQQKKIINSVNPIDLIQRLDDCKVGKKYASKFENVCTDIISYLFDEEFYISSSQHKTKDEMFRMDLICSLRGSTEFWKLLINFYGSKFVVFEFKNHTKKLSQNLVFVTEKYLFKSALRNVAIIISRKGFDNNAIRAAEGLLKEDGKLLLDITELDLRSMLIMKIQGQEPSDYLLEKTEKILMSISK